MEKSIAERLRQVSKNIDKLAQVKEIVESSIGLSPQEQICAAASIGAEYIAAMTGNQDESGLIYRAYEEILASLSQSPAIEEMLQWSRVTLTKEASYKEDLDDAWVGFRLALLSAGRSK